MGDTDNFPTRPSLLRQVRSLDNEEAWKEFLDTYTGLIASWCGRCGLRGDHVHEVVAQMQLKLVRVMPGFTYDPDRGRFRGWLRTTVQNTVKDYWRKLEST